MRTVTKTAYLYEELGTEAQEAARQWWRDQEAEHPTPGLGEYLRGLLKDEYGVDYCETYFSLGHCQGDGVAFEGRPDIALWATKDPELQSLLACLEVFSVAHCDPDVHVLDLVAVVIRHEGRHYHWNSMSVIVDGQGMGVCPTTEAHETMDIIVQQIEDHLEEKVKEISKALEKAGYDLIEDCMSDEMVAESIIAGEIEFEEDGTPM